MTAAPREDPTDAELAIAAAAGDRAALAEIYDRYADRLHDFCIGMLRNRDAAADCVQDTFCIAAASLRQLREPEKLRPWLYSVARNAVLRRIRERSREQLSDEVPDLPSTYSARPMRWPRVPRWPTWLPRPQADCRTATAPYLT